MFDSLTSLFEHLHSTLARAERDNASVYLKRVPPYCDIPAIQPAALAKATAPTNLDPSQVRLVLSCACLRVCFNVCFNETVGQCARHLRGGGAWNGSHAFDCIIIVASDHQYMLCQSALFVFNT